MELDIRDGILYFDGCDTTHLAQKYGTPLYLYSECAITERCGELRRTFLERWENTRAAYAAKAFCTPAMLRIVQREGLCVDVVSGGELATAMSVHFPPERIEFNGNNKSAAELETAVDYGIGRIIIDNVQELSILEQLCRTKRKRMKVLFRVSPGVKADTHDYIITGKKDSKFGIPLDEDILYPAVQMALRSEYLEFMGIHFHIGSQIFDIAPYLEALEIALAVMQEIRERFQYTLRELNVGGGFGVDCIGGRTRAPGDYLNPMMERIDEFCGELGVLRPCVVTELGRSIIADAGILLYTVGTIKEIPGVRKYVSVDGGMTDNIRPALYQARYRAVVANKADRPPEETVTLCGKCCESGDILIRDAELPHLERSDTLAVLSAGAYCYTMASNYNMHPVPAVVLVRDGQDFLLVRRQTYEDLLRGTLIPEHLR